MLLGHANLTTGQEPRRFRLSGYVRSAASHEVIRHALITADETMRGESNEDGFYFLTLPAGTHRLRVRAIGYVPLDTTIALAAATSLDFALAVRVTTLETVAVAAEGDRPEVDAKAPSMSVARLDLKTVSAVPAVLGEIDPIRSLTLLPGVSKTSDFSTTFNVRGGGADQNLILLDESTIYNPAHVLGFLSVFNSDAIDEVTLYKGAIPARFGGRLSSVVDIRQREGNANEFAGNASIGLLASRAAFEGPLPGRIGSFLIAGRRSYADLFLKASSDSNLRNNVAYFYDLNAKTNVRLGANGTLMASGYAGRDHFSYKDQFGVGWGNASGTLRWNQVVAGRLFSKAVLSTSDYDYGLRFPFGEDSVSWIAGIASTDLKIDEALHLGAANTLEFGLEATVHQFRPGEVQPRGDSKFIAKKLEARHGLATAAYLGQEVELGSRVSVRYGLRVSSFTRRGEATIYRYANDQPVVYDASLGRYEPGTVIDSVIYARGATVRSYSALEPRVSARFALTSAGSLKASYARTRQYLQLASKTNTPTPLDVWEPVGPYLRPQLADQFALGYASTVAGERYELSMETYFKRLIDVIDFVDGANVVLNDRLETVILQGTGRAYGLELYVRKRTGKLNGWVSYTLGRAEQRFATSTGASPGINAGRYYPAPYDKTHDVSIVATYPLRREWTIGTTFSLASGLPTTYPVSRYQIDGLLLAEYADRNSSRLPLYHRLDISATRHMKRGELQIGVINAYNHFNAQSISFRQSERNPLVSEAVQLSVFGIVPSVSYTFRW